jgi:hypothetical protein
MAVVGFFIMWGGVGTSDYYTLELGKTTPESVMPTIIIGVLLMIPALTHLIYRAWKENNQ